RHFVQSVAKGLLPRTARLGVLGALVEVEHESEPFDFSEGFSHLWKYFQVSLPDIQPITKPHNITITCVVIIPNIVIPPPLR
ncbi:hypothetical protein LCGC14_2787660, partial [marine sediment metagenome]